MDTPASEQEVGPTALPLAPKVGAWRLSGIRGRGTYGTVYRAIAEGRTQPGPVVDAPLFEWETLKRSQWTEDERADAEHLGHRPRRRDRVCVRRAGQADAAIKPRRWLPWLAAVLALGLWPEETGSLRTGLQPTVARDASEKDGDAVSLGDTAQSPSAVLDKSSTQDAIAQELPKQPLPGQLKPDAKGRCPNKQIAINGGCWGKVDFTPDECPGHGRLYQGGCYVPFFASSREPASAPEQR